MPVALYKYALAASPETRTITDDGVEGPPLETSTFCSNKPVCGFKVIADSTVSTRLVIGTLTAVVTFVTLLFVGCESACALNTTSVVVSKPAAFGTTTMASVAATPLGNVPT